MLGEGQMKILDTIMMCICVSEWESEWLQLSSFP
jgi:hypothetical protein